MAKILLVGFKSPTIAPHLTWSPRKQKNGQLLAWVMFKSDNTAVINFTTSSARLLSAALTIDGEFNSIEKKQADRKRIGNFLHQGPSNSP